MRHKPNMTDEYDREEVEHLGNPPKWMLDALNLNPNYVSWGPGEDYMWRDDESWGSQKIFGSWKEFGPWLLDDMNELVNFYFEIERDSCECVRCGGNGYHPDAQWVTESFYKHSSPFTQQTTQEAIIMEKMIGMGCSFKAGAVGRGNLPDDETLNRYGPEFRAFCKKMASGSGEWQNDLTPDEEKALKKAGRNNIGPLGHDAINRSILIEARLKRFGIPQTCPDCGGHGYIFTEEQAHLNLVLWWLHPRKGCSRGIRVERIKQAELPTVYGFLREAAERNAERFSKIPM